MKRLNAALGLVGVLVIMAALVLQIVGAGIARAATIPIGSPRSLTLEAGATDGGSDPGGNVKHLFKFDLTDTTDGIGSITFQYCTTAAPVTSGIGCVMPTGLDLTTVNLGTQTGATFFTGTTTTSNCDLVGGNPCTDKNTIVMSAASAQNISSNPTAVSYEFSGIVNPTTANATFFVRIATHTSTDGSGADLEAGTVSASTASPIALTGNMPESLVFCTGQTVTTNSNGVVDCTTATPGNIDFTSLFSPTATSLATSQMAASTNAGSGYSITVNGATLKSGSTNQINAMDTAGDSEYGVSQFGMNLTTNPGTAYTNAPNLSVMPTGYAVAADVAPANNGTNLNGSVSTTPSYDTPDTFKFTSGDTVAASTKGTDAQIFTVSYIVNVPGSQPAGTYATTLTYICTATY